VLALAYHESLLHDLLRQLRTDRLVVLLAPGRETEPPDEVARILAGVAEASLSGRRPAEPANALFREHLLAETGARRQCAFFDEVLASRRSAS
jgi:hypothetical protein